VAHACQKRPQTRQINYYLLLDQAIWRMHKKGKSSQKKTLQIHLFLCTSKWIFISGPSQLAHAKIIENDRKRAKNLIQISQVFNTSKWIFISGPGS
jgi:hypothetical protein